MGKAILPCLLALAVTAAWFGFYRTALGITLVAIAADAVGSWRGRYHG